MNCPRCGSSKTKKNGKSHTNKQNYFCHGCKRQFLENGQEWFISEEQRSLVDKLLLERISLAGICRVVGVSESWLQGYIKQLYDDLPDDLCADEHIPSVEAYLSDRMDEEIQRIELIKKIRIHLLSIKK